MSCLLQVSSGDANSNAEALNIAQSFHRVRQIGIAVVGKSRLAEIIGGDCSERSSGANHFNSIAEPADRTGAFVASYVLCIIALRVICCRASMG